MHGADDIQLLAASNDREIGDAHFRHDGLSAELISIKIERYFSANPTVLSILINL
jgi:hypothetical protein